ncbi:MAG: type II secretion system F family protein [Planctomycetales bacterium]
MTMFRYAGKDEAGDAVGGEIEAASETDAVHKLEQQGLRAIQFITDPPIAESSNTGPPTTESQPDADRVPESQEDVDANETARVGVLSVDEVAEMSQGIADFARRELPLAPGLKAMGAELPEGRLRTTIGRIARSLEKGMPLEDAVQDQGTRLPGHLRGLILAGVRSGKLPDVLEQFVLQQHLAADLKRNIRSTMSYPILLAMVGFGLFWFIETQLLPFVKVLYLDWEVEVPWLTQAMIWISDQFNWLAGGAALGAFLFWAGWRLALPKALRRRLLLHLPLFGSLWKWSAWSEFSYLLALLLDCETPLPVALELAGGGVADPEVRAASAEMKTEVEAGESLQQSKTCRQRFPALLRQLLLWGESRRSLPETLRLAAEMFESRAKIQAGLILIIVPLVGYGIIMIVTGVCLMGIYLPLMNLIQALS